MYPYDTEEDQDNPLRLKIDPAIAAFVASRRAEAPPPGPDLDALVKAEEARDAKGYLGQVLDQAGAMIRREKTGPLPALPKMDDSIRQFVLSQKLGVKKGSPLDALREEEARRNAGPAPTEWGAPEGMTRHEALAAGYGKAPGAPKTTPFDQGPPTEEQKAALRSYNLNPDAYPTMGFAARALDAAIAAGRTATAKAEDKAAGEKKEGEKKAEESKGKRYLGEYVTEAKQDLDPGVRSDFLLSRSTPGAEVMGKLGEIYALLGQIHGAPKPQQLRDLNQLISGTLTKYNKVAGLGALSGPDKDLLEKAMGSVEGLGSIFGNATGIVDLKRSIRNAAKILSDEVAASAGNYGATIKPGSPLDFGAWDKKNGGADAPAARRPIRTVNGETREWDGKAWVLPGGK